MPDSTDHFAAYVAEAARLMGIDLAQADAVAVATNLRNYRTLYEAIRGFESGDVFDPAAIYRP